MKGNLIVVCEGCHRQIHKDILTPNMFLENQKIRTARVLVLREMLDAGPPRKHSPSPLDEVLKEFARLPEINDSLWKEIIGGQTVEERNH